jgi:hypothetical protein
MGIIAASRLRQEIVAKYEFEETSGDAIDQINNFNGVLSGNVIQGVSGFEGNAYSYDGVDGFVTIPATIWNKLSQDRFTFQCYFNANDASKGSIVSDLVGSSFTDRKLFIDLRGENKIAVRIGNFTGSVGLDSVTTIDTNVWYKLKLKYDSLGSVKLFINDSLEDTGNLTNTPTASNRIIIGASDNGTGVVSGFFNGKIDKVLFYNG